MPPTRPPILKPRPSCRPSPSRSWGNSNSMIRSLDAKLAEIKANPATRAFIIADAKDADMAFGVRALGPRSYLAARGERPARFSPEVWTRDEFGYRNLPEFLD